jgi:hypothetical protein
VRFTNLASVGLTITVVVHSSCRSLSLSYRFKLDLDCRNLSIEFCDESMSRFKLIDKLVIGGTTQ